jgi:hypothetical protein
VVLSAAVAFADPINDSVESYQEHPPGSTRPPPLTPHYTCFARDLQGKSYLFYSYSRDRASLMAIKACQSATGQRCRFVGCTVH